MRKVFAAGGLASPKGGGERKLKKGVKTYLSYREESRFSDGSGRSMSGGENPKKVRSRARVDRTRSRDLTLLGGGITFHKGEG